jgi:hypothetical protein
MPFAAHRAQAHKTTGLHQTLLHHNYQRRAARDEFGIIAKFFSAHELP